MSNETASPASMVASRWKDADLRQEQHNAKRRIILDQAARMFADHGFHQTTIEQIAVALEVSKPTIYYYIDSKEDILFQILQIALADLDERLPRQAGGPAKAIDRLERFLQIYAEIILSDFGVCMALVTDRSLNPEQRKKLRTLKKEFEIRFRNIIADGQRDGSILVDNPRFYANAVLGAYNWMPQWFSRSGPAAPEEVGKIFFQFFRRAVQPSC